MYGELENWRKDVKKIFYKINRNEEKKEFDITKIRNVYISGGRIGDILIKSPILEFLPKRNKDLNIDIEVAEGCDELLKYHPNISKIFIAKKKSSIKIKNIFYEIYLSYKLRNKYDLYFDFSRNLRFLYLLKLRIMNARYIIGCYRMEKFGIKKDELTIIDRYIDEQTESHGLAISIKALSELGLTLQNYKYKIYLGELEDKYKTYFKRKKINIIFNFLASIKSRSLSEDDVDYFIENIPKLKEDIILHLLITPHYYETFRKKIEKMNLKNIRLLPKNESILEVAAIIKFSDLLFSVDTGVIHIASTYNIPIVGIYTEDKDSLTTFAPKSKEKTIIIGKREKYLKLDNREEILKEIREMLDKINNWRENYEKKINYS